MWYLLNIFCICDNRSNVWRLRTRNITAIWLLFCTTALTLFNIVSNSSYEFSYSLFTFFVNSEMLSQLRFLAHAIYISVNTANLYGNTALEPVYRVSVIVVSNIC